jgi:hypothetical protein
MWAVTGWAVATWLRVTLLLALGVAAGWWLLSPGWFVACCIGAALAEVWTLRQLAREWAYEAHTSWWWTP